MGSRGFGARSEHFSGMICAAVLKMVGGDKESHLALPHRKPTVEPTAATTCDVSADSAKRPAEAQDRPQRQECGPRRACAAGVRRPRAPAGATASGTDGPTGGIARAGWAGWSGKTAEPRDDGRGRKAEERSPRGRKTA